MIEIHDNTELSQHRPDHKVVVVMPGRETTRAFLRSLEDRDLDVPEVLMLHGPEGIAKFDLHGDNHGWWAHVRRTLKNVGGADANILFVYYEALEHGKVLLFVPLAPDGPRTELLDLLRAHKGSAMSYFTPHTMESIPFSDHL